MMPECGGQAKPMALAFLFFLLLCLQKLVLGHFLHSVLQ
jgi:hypothetical protein